MAFVEDFMEGTKKPSGGKRGHRKNANFGRNEILRR